MGLRIERIFGTQRIESSNDIPLWKTCAVHIENVTSKYFLEFAQGFLPHNICKAWVWAVQWIYWSATDWFFPCWMKQFKRGVEVVRQESVFQFDPAKLKRFLKSEEASRMREKFPFDSLWSKDAKWLRPAMGTCYGESLALMKYRDDCSISSGFERGEDLSAADLGNEVLFLQAMHFLDIHLKWVMEAKKVMKNQGITTRDITSKEDSDQEAWLFHYLRKSNVSRLQARGLVEQCQELFQLPMSELQEMRDSIAQDIQEMVGTQLDFHAYTSEDDWAEIPQSELDRDVCNFLLEESGVFIFVGLGKNQMGHALFLKIEDGECMAYDPATQECFTMPHTREGINKALELMKKLLEVPNFGGKTRYQVIAPL